MKFRVIFIKKKNLFYIIPVILIILILSFLIYRNFFYISSPTFANVLEDKTLKSDLNGDGLDDKLYIKHSGNRYFIKAKIKEKTYTLSTDEKQNTLSNYYPYWPLRITILDVSRNKVPEIFLQGSWGKNSLQRFFVFDGHKFKNIFSSSNNILGFVDCTNNRTPKIITGRLHDGSMLLTNYIFTNYRFENYNLDNTETFAGNDTICSFVNFIESLPGSHSYIPPNVFSPNISNDDMYLIDKLANLNNTYVFQDAFFMEKKCDNHGNISELSWTLNFKGIPNSDNTSAKNYTLNLILAPDNSKNNSSKFKIISMY